MQDARVSKAKADMMEFLGAERKPMPIELIRHLRKEGHERGAIHTALHIAIGESKVYIARDLTIRARLSA